MSLKEISTLLYFNSQSLCFVVVKIVLFDLVKEISLNSGSLS